MQYLKADTEITVRVGPFLDDTDGKTAETGLTITQPDVRLSKNGGDFAQKSAAETLVHDENGWYILTLSTTDTNTEGRLDLAIHESGALPVWREFMVVNANVYDSLFAAATTDYLQVDTIQVEGTDATDQIRDSVVDDATRIDASGLNTLSGHDPGEAIMGTSDLGTGSGLTTLATATELAKVPKSDSTVTWNATALADINAQCDTAISDAALGTAAELAKVPKSDATVSFNATALGDIKTQAAAVLTDANTELAAIPTTTGGLRAMIQFLFQYFRNARTETAGVESLKKEDGTTELGSRTLSDDSTTFTRGEMS